MTPAFISIIIKCPACEAMVNGLNDHRDRPGGKVSGICLCNNCGHLFSLDDGVPHNLSNSERERMQRGPDASRIREAQAAIIGGLIG